MKKNKKHIRDEKSLHWDNQWIGVSQGRPIKWKDKSTEIIQTEIKSEQQKEWEEETDRSPMEGYQMV